jgi:uncharacterized membrane protein YgcG
VSVDSGVSGPVEGPVVPAAPRASSSPRVAPSRITRPGVARADALADAVSTPSFRTGRGRPRRRGRRVTRIVRRIELWSVLKIALVFNTIMLGVVLGSVALLWGLANTTGLVDDLEGFLRDAGFEDFRFQGERMFEQVAFIGAVGALAATVFMVLATALLNLISEITGGIRFVVIEEIVEEPAPPARPPAPLALPTIPPTAPPLAPPVPAPVPAATDPARDDRGPDRPTATATAAPAPHPDDDDDPDAGPLAEAKASMDKAAASRSSTTKRPSGRPSSNRGTGTRSSTTKPRSGSTSSRSSSSGGGSGPARRVRRQTPRPAPKAEETDAVGEDDDTSS